MIASKATGEFVIESARQPKPEVTYFYYRCQQNFEKLTGWLREQGVNADKPLHALRKEFGSGINATFGIHAASRALRHADIGITSQVYTDSRVIVVSAMGHSLRPP